MAVPDAQNTALAHDIRRGDIALRRGRFPLLCWDENRAWIVTRPKSPQQATDLAALQRKRGIRVKYYRQIGAGDGPDS
jgi:hypothetical protein